MSPLRAPLALSLLTLSYLLLGCRLSPRAPCPAQPEASRSAAHTALRVALTVDDVPGSFEASPDYPKSRVMDKIVATLRAHGVDDAVGFVNGVYAEGDSDARAGLRTWIDAGFQVGNHSYSHLSARALEASAFLLDVARNQSWLTRETGGKAPRYFRFPYLERGKSPAERRVISRGLAQQGYLVADVSVDFADWAFVGPYARCMQRQDAAALRGLSEQYLQNAEAALFWSAEAGERLFARSIPQVLLLHAHVPTAENLDALLSTYERAGVRWISLQEALDDPAFAQAPELDQRDTSMLSEKNQRSGSPLRSFVPRSLPLLELVCR